MKPEELELIRSELNIIINCSITADFQRLDEAVRINVLGSLQLAQMAKSCPRFECLVNLSDCYANSDRNGGYVEEKIYDSGINWKGLYEKIISMNPADVER